MTQPAHHPQTLNAREVAALLGVAESTLYDHLRREGQVGGVPGIRIGRTWKFSRQRIEALVGNASLQTPEEANRGH